MIPFFEPKVYIKNEKERESFDRIALRLGLSGYVIMGEKFQKKGDIKEKKNQTINYISRFEIDSDQINNVKNLLPKVRHQYELLSIKTSSDRVAQWVAKDNRVDILTIPIKNVKEIITKELANVTAQNRLFLEVDLSFLIKENEVNQSYQLRIINKVMNILVQRKTPFIFTMNVQKPLEFRDCRSIIALGDMIGIPEEDIKNHMMEFYHRLILNRKKLSAEYVNPGIWLTKKEIDSKDRFDFNLEENRISIDDSLALNEKMINSIKIELAEKKMERQRYLLFEILTEKDFPISEQLLINEIWKCFTKLFGEIGSSRSGFHIICFDQDRKIGILRCSHFSLKSLRAAMAIINKIEKNPTIIHILTVSGTVKKLLNVFNLKSKN